MGRRFLLVGLYVVWPYEQGTVMQVAVANVTSIVYLALQLQAKPFRKLFDDYLARACSISLTVMLLCCAFYKNMSLTQLPEIQARMSLEQRADFKVR